MKHYTYLLKSLIVAIITTLAVTASCKKKPEQIITPEPPVIAITTPPQTIIDLTDETDRPRIQGSITTSDHLTNVKISAITGSTRQVVEDITTFTDAKNYTINFLPTYALNLTGIRVEAIDSKNQRTQQDIMFSVIQSDPTVNVFTVMVSGGPNGTVTPNGNVPVQRDSALRIVYKANDGYRVASVLVNGTANETAKSDTVYTFPRVLENQTFAVTFELIPPPEFCTVSISGGANGTVAPLGDSVVQRDSVIRIFYKPDEGYRVASVLINGANNIAAVLDTVHNLRPQNHTTFAVAFEEIPIIPPPPPGMRLAFPSAEGFGAETWGGRGGRVLTVTTLEDNASGTPIPGSLRWAVTQQGARTVVFAVGGEIKLKRRLDVNRDSITIAGQTAPGDGITIRDHEFTVNGASQVIVRYIRFRMGDESGVTEGDAAWGRRRANIILDHCSMSWSTDEISSWYDNQNFTMQWCILAESLRVSTHTKGTHGYTGIWGGQKASFHKNLLIHSDNRNPRFCGSRYSGRPDLELVDFRNNVLYNYGNSSTAGEGGSYNMVGNYYQPGAGTASGNVNRIMQPWGCTGQHSQPAGTTGVFYVADNVLMNVNGTVNTNITNNNWNGVSANSSVPGGTNFRSDTEFEKGYITTLTAEEAYRQVLARAGASLRRDAVDLRLVDETANRLAPVRASGGGGTRAGMIDSQTDVGGWPTLNPGTPWVSTANDGIPDVWKVSRGLNVALDVANEYTLSDVYTNIEMYMNWLVGE